MALVNYVTAIPAFAERDFRNQNRLISVMSNSLTSQKYNAAFANTGNGANFAYNAKVSLWAQSSMGGIDTAEVSSYNDADEDPTSVSYTEPTDVVLTPSINRLSHFKFVLPELDADKHPQGAEGIISECALAGSQSILDAMTSNAITTVLANGQVEDGYAGTAFGLRTDSEANFRTDMKDIVGAMRKQDKGSGTWVMVLPAVYEGVLSAFSSSSIDMQAAGINSVIEGKFQRLYGCNFLFESGFSGSSSAFAIDLSRWVVLDPFGMRVRKFTDKSQPLADFHIMYKEWGITPVGKDITGYTNTPSAAYSGAQKEGTIKISIS